MLRRLLLTLTLLAGPALAELSVTEEGDRVVLRAEGQVVARLSGAEAVEPTGEAVRVSGADLEIELPGFGRGLALYRHKRFWTSPRFVSDPASLPGNSQMLLWERPGQPGYHVLLPTGVGGLGTRGDAFGAWHGTGVVYASGLDPHETLGRAARQALVGSEGRLRIEKPYPEPFRYLGWCSWNAFYQGVDRDKLLAAARALRADGVPARFLLIDDGWMTTAGRKLAAFEADPEKFPGGLAPLVSELKGPLEFRWVGVWHTLQGYWDGVAPGLTPGLMVGNEELTFPDPRGSEFYARWATFLRAAGIDFVKVDNQSGQARFVLGLMPLWEAGSGAQRLLQAAYGESILNCMEMTLENVYNYGRSNVARSSDDYLPGEESARHLVHNAYNAVWLSHFAYPDYDMFESGLPDGAYHAVARALSGGPVYCTDRPGRADAAVLQALCHADGRLLQPDAPALVPPELLFVDPREAAVPLILEAPVTRPGYACRLVGLFNVSTREVRASLGREGSIAYLWRSGEVGTKVALGVEGWELAFEVPLERGVALLGALDKYLAPAAITRVDWSGDVVSAELYEGGRFGAWLERAPVSVEVDGSPARFTYRDRLLEVEAPPRRCRVSIATGR